MKTLHRLFDYVQWTCSLSSILEIHLCESLKMNIVETRITLDMLPFQGFASPLHHFYEIYSG